MRAFSMPVSSSASDIGSDHSRLVCHGSGAQVFFELRSAMMIGARPSVGMMTDEQRSCVK